MNFIECPSNTTSLLASNSRKSAWSCITSWIWLWLPSRSKLATKWKCSSIQQSMCSLTTTTMATSSIIQSLTMCKSMRWISIITRRRISTLCTIWSDASSWIARKSFYRSIVHWLDYLMSLWKSTSRSIWRTFIRLNGQSAFKKLVCKISYPRILRDTS